MNIVPMNDGNTLQQLRDRLVELNGQTVTIQAAADAAKRDFSDDETSQLDVLFADIERTKAQIVRRERIEDNNAALASATGRKTQAGEPVASDPSDPVVAAKAAALPAK